jgi:CxxC-x17-CxxC domain-containing protein
MSSEPKRGMAFIDFENINITARKEFGLRYINFGKLREILLKDLRHVGCILYLPFKMRDLQGHIQKSGLEVKVVNPGKSIDGRLILDLVTGAWRNDFDIAVIASGDRDYIPVAESVKRMEKVVRIASFSKALAYGMGSVSDDVINLDEHIKDISLQVYKYKCTDCGKEFELPFKLYPSQTPYCQDCIKKHHP